MATSNHKVTIDIFKSESKLDTTINTNLPYVRQAPGLEPTSDNLVGPWVPGFGTIHVNTANKT